MHRDFVAYISCPLLFFFIKSGIPIAGTANVDTIKITVKATIIIDYRFIFAMYLVARNNPVTPPIVEHNATHKL